jgi:Amt family ammonium transporter
MFAKNAINSAGKGWLTDGNIGQMWIQFQDVAYVFLYCGIGTFIILKVIDMIVGLRVSPEVEVEGLDINLHGETIHG